MLCAVCRGTGESVCVPCMGTGLDDCEDCPICGGEGFVECYACHPPEPVPPGGNRGGDNGMLSVRWQRIETTPATAAVWSERLGGPPAGATAVRGAVNRDDLRDDGDGVLRLTAAGRAALCPIQVARPMAPGTLRRDRPAASGRRVAAKS